MARAPQQTCKTLMQISPEKSQSGDAPALFASTLEKPEPDIGVLVFANLLIILASSLVMIALFRRLRLPPVLGYLCVGLMVGPTAFNWVNESEHLPDVAELGWCFCCSRWAWSFPCRR
jgi:hypothetical protein